MVTGDPLTPANIQLNPRTRVGSPVDRTVRRATSTAATLFVSRNLTTCVEFVFADNEPAYPSDDLAMLPVTWCSARDQDFDKARRPDAHRHGGRPARHRHPLSGEKVTAWTVQETAGAFRSVAVVGERHVRSGRARRRPTDRGVRRQAGGRRRDDRTADSRRTNGAALATSRARRQGGGRRWVRPDAEVTDGKVTLDLPAARSRSASALPTSSSRCRVAPTEIGGAGRAAVSVTSSRPFGCTRPRRCGSTPGAATWTCRSAGSAVPRRTRRCRVFTGDKTVRAFGWRHTGTAPLWRIAQDTPAALHPAVGQLADQYQRLKEIRSWAHPPRSS